MTGRRGDDVPTPQELSRKWRGLDSADRTVKYRKVAKDADEAYEAGNQQPFGGRISRAAKHPPWALPIGDEENPAANVRGLPVDAIVAVPKDIVLRAKDYRLQRRRDTMAKSAADSAERLLHATAESAPDGPLAGLANAFGDAVAHDPVLGPQESSVRVCWNAASATLDAPNVFLCKSKIHRVERQDQGDRQLENRWDTHGKQNPHYASGGV